MSKHDNHKSQRGIRAGKKLQLRLPAELDHHFDLILKASGRALETMLLQSGKIRNNLDQSPNSNRPEKYSLAEYLITESINDFIRQFTPDVPFYDPHMDSDDPISSLNAIHLEHVLIARAEVDQLLNINPHLLNYLDEDPRDLSDEEWSKLFLMRDFIKLKLEEELLLEKLESLRTTHLAHNPENTEQN